MQFLHGLLCVEPDQMRLPAQSVAGSSGSFGEIDKDFVYTYVYIYLSYLYILNLEP